MYLDLYSNIRCLVDAKFDNISCKHTDLLLMNDEVYETSHCQAE